MILGFVVQIDPEQEQRFRFFAYGLCNVLGVIHMNSGRKEYIVIHDCDYGRPPRDSET